MEKTYTFKEFNKMLNDTKEHKLNKVVQVGATLIPFSMTTHNVYAFSPSQELMAMLESLKNTIISAMEEGIKTAIIGTGRWALNGIIEASYPICLTIAIIAVILYIGGFKKAGKYASVSFIIYFLLQSIKCVM